MVAGTNKIYGDQVNFINSVGFLGFSQMIIKYYMGIFFAKTAKWPPATIQFILFVCL